MWTARVAIIEQATDGVLTRLVLRTETTGTDAGAKVAQAVREKIAAMAAKKYPQARISVTHLTWELEDDSLLARYPLIPPDQIAALKTLDADSLRVVADEWEEETTQLGHRLAGELADEARAAVEQRIQLGRQIFAFVADHIETPGR